MTRDLTQMIEIFKYTAQTEFQFLVNDYGFHLEEIFDTSITWHKDQFYVKLLYDIRRSYEISLVISNSDLQQQIYPFSFDEILPYVGMSPLKQSFQASDRDRLSYLIPKIASLFKEACEKRNLFSQESFSVLNNIRKNNCFAYKQEKKRQYLTLDGDIAWKEKNYEKLLDLYEAHIEMLSEVEKKRYDYIKRKLNR
jgi:hypothetical protein